VDDGKQQRYHLKLDIVISPKEKRNGVSFEARLIDGTVNSGFEYIICAGISDVLWIQHLGAYSSIERIDLLGCEAKLAIFFIEVRYHVLENESPFNWHSVDPLAGGVHDLQCAYFILPQDGKALGDRTY
jgi:hypothetical protein